MTTEGAIDGQDLLVKQMAKLMSQLEELQAENAKLRQGATKPSTIDGKKTASHNWEVIRDRTSDGDKLIITVSLLDGGHDISEGGKHAAITSVRNIPFRFGDEGDVQILPSRKGFRENEFMFSLYVGKRVDR